MLVVQVLDLIRVLTIWILGSLVFRIFGLQFFRIFGLQFFRMFGFRSFSKVSGLQVFRIFWMVRFFRMFGFSRVFQGCWFGLLILDLDIWFLGLDIVVFWYKDVKEQGGMETFSTKGSFCPTKERNARRTF